MESIFHEKQQGRLCGQHCLNALLQDEYFTAVDLATLAQQIDEQERQRMAEAGTHTPEYRRFIQEPSHNMDDSGYFSVQVLCAALRVWSLDVVPFTSSRPPAVAARHNPSGQKAYICNYQDHWLTVRRVGRQWFNLNSLLTEPHLLSDTYLTEFLHQLQREGYTIFVVVGVLPACTADQLLSSITVVQPRPPPLISHSSTATAAFDDQLQAAIAASLQAPGGQSSESDVAIQTALQASVLDCAVSAEDVRTRRESFLSRFDKR